VIVKRPLVICPASVRIRARNSYIRVIQNITLCFTTIAQFFLTSVICKTMESVVKENIVKHVFENDLIFPSQHGFIVTNLLEYLEDFRNIFSLTQLMETVFDSHLNFLCVLSSVLKLYRFRKKSKKDCCSKSFKVPNGDHLQIFLQIDSSSTIYI